MLAMLLIALFLTACGCSGPGRDTAQPDQTALIASFDAWVLADVTDLSPPTVAVPWSHESSCFNHYCLMNVPSTADVSGYATAILLTNNQLSFDQVYAWCQQTVALSDQSNRFDGIYPGRRASPANKKFV